MCCRAGPSMTSMWERNVSTCVMAGATATMAPVGVIRDTTVSRLCDQDVITVNRCCDQDMIIKQYDQGCYYNEQML